MGKLEIGLFCLVIISGIVTTTCNAATYMVGDSSGWDISTDLDSWAQSKTFSVGDVLVFQYSSTHSVYEVTRENSRSCNTTNALRTFSNGNTTVLLSKPGQRFFICGNRLHCFAGMRLQVDVQGNGTSPAPAGAPNPSTGLPQPSSKRNDPAGAVPSSGGHGGYRGGGGGIMGILVSMVFYFFVCNIISLRNV